MDYENLHKETLAALQQMVLEGKITEEIARRICSDFVKESEDERIRKSLINTFSVYYKYEPDGELDGKPVEDIIAWLEKQGKQKPIVWSAYDKATLEYIIEDIKELCDNETEEGSIETYNREINLLQAINKSIKLSSYTNPAAWSEEDEKNLKGIINEIEANKSNAPDYDLSTYNMFLSWLESIKERYTWKPSNEQIEALLKLEEMHVLEHEKNQENAHLYMVVKNIREQLLKLKGE